MILKEKYFKLVFVIFVITISTMGINYLYKMSKNESSTKVVKNIETVKTEQIKNENNKELQETTIANNNNTNIISVVQTNQIFSATEKSDVDYVNKSYTKNKINTDITKKNTARILVASRGDGFINFKIPMPREHQEYLYKKCLERNLNYKKTLALIKHESEFDPNKISSTNDYGYFQINKQNHKYLSEILNTSNSPLDPYINIEWGTYMLKSLYDYWMEKGKSGDELDEIVLSCYNKGTAGYSKYGKAINYINKYKEELQFINSLF